jgi:predicted dehydrogenase
MSNLTRRRFLQTSAAMAAMASLPRSGVAQDAPAGKKVGFALVGLGRLSIGQLLPAFATCKNARVTALVSGHPDKAKDLAGKYGVPEKSIYNYDNFDSIKENPDVDVVFVVLPNSMHAEYTIRAAKAAKHVLCEKPMANTVEECQQMIDACKQANRKLMIAYRLHYEPINQKAIQICREKAYGAVKVIEADFGFNIGPNQWRLDKKLAGGGPLPDVGVYCINATRYLAGEEPVQIGATIYQPKDDPRFKEVEESAAWWMRFPSGAIAHCATSYGGNPGNRYRFSTRDAQVTVDPAFSYGGLKMTIANRGKSEPLDLPNIDQFAAEMDHFAECVLNDKQPLTPGEEGLADVKVLKAIYQSAEIGKAVNV